MINYKKNSVLINNTIMLVIFSMVKILFPLILLPYFTRVLSLEAFGAVSFIKSYMVYAQLFVDFGFILSAVKSIVEAKNDKNVIGKITGETILAKMMLSIILLIFTFIISIFVPIMKDYILFTFLSLIVIILSNFLLDYLFRGLEKMHILVLAFLVLKTLSTLLTILFVKNDSHIMLIPIFEIISSLLAIVYVFYAIRKMHIKIILSSFLNAFERIKESFSYFISSIATTAFGAMNTLIIGIYLLKSDIAIWAVAMQIISAILAMYSPIVNGLYTEMIRHKNLSIIKKTLKIFMPIIIIGVIVLFLFAKPIVIIIAGPLYTDAAYILRILLGILIISFPAMLLGWPSLGAIDKVRETSNTTLVAAIVQITGIAILLFIDDFTLVNIAVIRVITELFLFSMRYYYVIKFKYLFV